MNRQRKVVITTTYNDMGVIVDTKAEELDLSAQPEKRTEERTETHACDCIERQAAIDALDEYIEEYSDLDENGYHDPKWCAMQEARMTIQRLPSAPSAQPAQHGRIFQEIVVEYPSISAYPEHEGKPYFSIKYMEDEQGYIGYGTYKPEVLSEYLKEYFMPSAQPEHPFKIQDILDYLDTVLHPIISPEHWNVYSELHDMISTLPSAQPDPDKLHLQREQAYMQGWEDARLIDRQAAIDALDRIGSLDTEADRKYARSVFEELPSAQPEQRWIPCSERLPDHPENDDYYLVTIQCEHYYGWDDYVTGFAEWTKQGWDELSCYIGQIKVVAWMPLPAPYLKEGEK